MKVHLTPQLESLVQSKVRSGGYNSASEVVREALRMMQERDELLQIRKNVIAKQIADGLKSLAKGEGIAAEDAFAVLDHRHRQVRRRKST